jgi:DNA-binding CsgD family transcriptional regulator
LDRTVSDPTEWNRVCDALADIVGATGGLLIPYDEEDRSFTLPHSSSLGELFERFVSSGWHKRDFRATGFPKAISSGFVTDQDLITPEAMRKHPYYQELLLPAGMQWFAGIAFKVDGKVWGAAVQGTPERGPFLSGDVMKLMRFREDISLAAKRVAALGFQRVESMEKTFTSADRGVLALNWSGKIAWSNTRAEAILQEAELASNSRLRSQDPELDRKLSHLVSSAVGFRHMAGFVMPSPILVHLRDRRVIAIDAIPMPRDFRAVLSGASALVTMHEVAAGKTGRADLRTRFRLTSREAELAIHLAAGDRIAEVAETMGMSISTARQHLKAILAKTGTHRQAELVALLARLDG